MNASELMGLFREALLEVYQRTLDYLPTILTALFLVLLGWLLAAGLRAVIARVTSGVMKRMPGGERIRASLESSRLVDSVPRFAGGVAYWLTLALFVSAAVERLEFQIVAGLFSNLTEYLPHVFLAALLVFFGIVFGNVARNAIASAAASAGIANADRLGRLGQISVVLIAGVVAADQIGIQSTFLMVTVAITVGTTLGGVALAFGIGSGPVVANIIASYYVRRMYRVGENVAIGSTRGRIVEMSPIAVAVETADGRVQVPSRQFIDQASVLVRKT